MRLERRIVMGAVVAIEVVLLWRAVEPAYECGPDVLTHNKLSPLAPNESTRRRLFPLRASCRCGREEPSDGGRLSLLLRPGRAQADGRRLPRHPGRRRQAVKQVRTFGTMTADLLALADWLRAAG